MTKEEAVKILKGAIKKPNTKDGYLGQALDMAIKALEQQSSYNSIKTELKQKPKAKAFDILHFVADNAGLSTFEAIEKAYNIGVSEQEPILDKIRDEIEEYKSRQLTLAIGVKDLEKGKQIALEYVFAILDKYKAESEDEG